MCDPQDATQITTLVSVVGGVVGFIALTVAWSQMRIASAKTKLELYNMRFHIYESAFYYHKALCDGARDEKEKAEIVFFTSLRASKFLFDPKDGIYEILFSISNNGVLIHDYEKEEVGSSFTFPDGQKAHVKILESVGMLNHKFVKYISFHNIRGWTLF